MFLLTDYKKILDYYVVGCVLVGMTPRVSFVAAKPRFSSRRGQTKRLVNELVRRKFVWWIPRIHILG